MMKQLYGTGVALVTPFDARGAIDYKALNRLLRHTAKGVDYYVVMGTTGESATVSAAEKQAILEFVLAHNPAKLPVVLGIGGNNTAAVLETIKNTDFNGITAVLSVSPYYNKPSQEGIFQHFTAIADACPVPVILYNVPGRTASNITAQTTLRLAEHENIIGVKEASGSLEQCMQIAKSKPEDFMLISGDDLLTLAMYAIGGSGVISVLANALPQIFKRIKLGFVNQKLQQARKAQFELLEINGPMYEESNPVGVKYLLERMGICERHVRMPLLAASKQLQDKISALHQKSQK